MNPPSPEPTGAPAPLQRKMNIVTVFDPERMVRTHTVGGFISLPAFRGILEGLYTSKQFNPDMNALWDLRQADFSGIVPEDVRELMHVVVANWGRSGRCRSAVVVATEAGFGVARTYAGQFGRMAPCQIRIFMDLDEARQWLGAAENPAGSLPAACQADSPAGR